MNYRYFVDSYSAQGPRQSNQDDVAVDADQGYAVVADGMGGAAGGELASQTVVAAVRSALSADQRKTAQLSHLCEKVAEAANRSVWDLACHQPHLRGMGSTLALVCLAGSNYCAVNVGDSRSYLCRGGELTQLSHDHSLVQERVDAGIINPEQARYQPDRNIITRVMGGAPEVVPYITEGTLQKGDLFLLTSDGVHGVLSTSEMQNILSAPSSLSPSEALVRAALSQSTQDNATAATLRVLDSGCGTVGQERRPGLLTQITQWLKRQRGFPRET